MYLNLGKINPTFGSLNYHHEVASQGNTTILEATIVPGKQTRVMWFNENKSCA